ncbi:MAG TPA: PAS domain S-box protein, partial [Phycisphaerales bacterium]|nr:PAS domain S-box protein [Phycisphaerales bacterium]
MGTPTKNQPGTAALTAAVVAMTIATVAGAGWVFDRPVLADWGSEIATLPNTVVATASAAAALLLLRLGRVRLASTAAALTLGVGVFVLFQHTTGIDVGIDRLLLLRPWGEAGTAAPGRMGPPASLCFALLGSSLLLLARGRRVAAAAAAMAGGVAVAAVASLSLVGYLYGVDTLYSLPRLTAIALPTSVALAALGAGVSFAADARLCSAGPGREPAERMLLGVGLWMAVVFPVAVGWLRVSGGRSGLFDVAYGAALRTLVEMLVLAAITWAAAAAVGRRERTQRRSQEELTRRGAQLSAFLETAVIGLHRVGPDGTILWANDAELKMLGYAREEYVGRDIREFHADPQVIEDILSRLGRGERLHGYEARLRRRDGGVATVLIDSSVYRENGRFVHTQCFTRDITAERATEAALRESESRARQMIDAIPAAVYTTDIQGRLTAFNPAAAALSGRTPELGTDRWCVTGKLFYPDGTPLPHDRCPMAQVLRGEPVPPGAEAIAERPDGSRIWFQPFPTLLRDAEGRVTGAVNMLLDITARKQHEETAARLAAIVESSDDAIISKNLQGIVQTWNAGAERMYGYTAAEMIGRPFDLLVPPGRYEEDVLRRLINGERVEHFETVRVTKDGRLIDVTVTASPI